VDPLVKEQNDNNTLVFPQHVFFLIRSFIHPALCSWLLRLEACPPARRALWAPATRVCLSMCPATPSVRSGEHPCSSKPSTDDPLALRRPTPVCAPPCGLAAICPRPCAPHPSMWPDYPSTGEHALHMRPSVWPCDPSTAEHALHAPACHRWRACAHAHAQGPPVSEQAGWSWC
jgi:hypothetical protein